MASSQTSMRLACSRETVQLLAGHSDGTVHEDYVHKERLPVSLLKDGIELLRYDEVVTSLRGNS